MQAVAIWDRALIANAIKSQFNSTKSRNNINLFYDSLLSTVGFGEGAFAEMS